MVERMYRTGDCYKFKLIYSLQRLMASRIFDNGKNAVLLAIVTKV